jgi:dTDP-4-amino-4,6-dideoxygalactose transaminase
MTKTQASELAVFGGPPAFAAPLHVGTPNIGNRDRLLARINDLLDRRWLTNNGRYVQEFEREIAARMDAAHCIATCNGTVALEIAVRACGLRGEVLVPSFTFVATAHALQWQEITPVFCDIDPRTHTLDPARIEPMITPRTTGLIGVHLWGRPCAVEALAAIARRRRLALLFDAAHAFGCSCNGRMLGAFGDAVVLSFHATKFLNTFEGGAILTNDDALAARIRLMKNFGFAGYDRVVFIGTNGKMSEVSAAMGLTGLDSLDAFIEANRRNYRTYRAELHGLPGIALQAYDEREKCNFQYIVVEVDERQAGLTRDQLVEVLHAENVVARRYFHPGCHRMEPYRSHFPHAGLVLPETERLAARVLLLPTGTAVGPDAIRTVAAVLRTALREAGAVRSRLRAADSAHPDPSPPTDGGPPP